MLLGKKLQIKKYQLQHRQKKNKQMKNHSQRLSQQGLDQTSITQNSDEKYIAENNSTHTKEGQNRTSMVQYLFCPQQIGSRQLQHCSVQQLFGKLELTLLGYKFVTNLFESIYTIWQNIFKNEYSSISQVLKRKNKLLVNKLIKAEMFSQDIKTLQGLTIHFDSQLNRLWEFLDQKLDLNQNQMHCLVKTIFQQAAHQSQLQINQLYIFDPQQTYFKITQQNYLIYLKSIHHFLYSKYQQIELYNYLKTMLQKWILNDHQRIYQRNLNLLHQLQGTQQPHHPSTYADIQPQSINHSNLNSKNPQAKDIQLYDALNHLQEQSEAEIFHETSVLINLNLLAEASSIKASQIQNLNQICCLNFVYSFTAIQSNQFCTNKRQDSLIILEYPSPPFEFKQLENPVKEAASALLNNAGGFILIGFKKISQFYVPHCPYKFSEDTINKNRSQIINWITNIGVCVNKNDSKKQTENVKVDFIPIFNYRKTDEADKVVLGHAREQEFVWRIFILPLKNFKLKIHPIADQFYDLDPLRQTFYQLKDSNTEKDLVYKKLRQKTQNYWIYYKIDHHNNQQVLQPVQKVNEPKLIRHLTECIAAQSGAFRTQQKSKQQSTISQGNVQALRNEKNNVKVQQKASDPIKKETSYNQQGTEFKYVNLIVLENKQIKTACEKHLIENKVGFRIEKLQGGLKKLSKTTYIIHHHKKFDEINNYLQDFKKQFNANKKIILISAQKSVFIENTLKYQDLQKVKKFLVNQFPQVVQNEKLWFVEDSTKYKRSYIKTENKLSGIYLYFILSELDYKPKMKNVPQLYQDKLVQLDSAIQSKKKTQENQIQFNHDQEWKNFFKNYYQKICQIYPNFDRNILQTNFHNYFANDPYIASRLAQLQKSEGYLFFAENWPQNYNNIPYPWQQY